MKISNSKKQLAKIISENGGWREGEFAAQDKDGDVFKFDSKPVMGVSREVWMSTGNGTYKLCCSATIKGWHQTILSRDEYFHLYPARDVDGWIEWNGGECPVDVGTIVDVKHRDGDIGIRCHAGMSSSEPDGEGPATAEDWSHLDEGGDIIAYRLHKPEQARSTAVGDDETNLATKEEPEAMEYKPTIEQLAADYRNLLDFAQRKQREADDAKADAEARLKALELAGEAIGLTVSPITAKKEHELVITDWRDLRVGDLVVITGSGNEAWSAFEGKELSVARTGCSEDELMFMSEDGDEWYASGNTGWSFIRRP